jgi:uncharacterized membrane protein
MAKQREENEIEFSRIVAFSDGVFAIAITLLVLQLGVEPNVPNHDLGKALLDERQDLFAYAISFAVIGRFWLVHHRFFGDVTGFDGRLIMLNLFYLAWIVLIPFSSQILGDHGGAEAAVILYSINLVGVILAGVLLFADARRAGLSKVSAEQARSGERPAGPSARRASPAALSREAPGRRKAASGRRPDSSGPARRAPDRPPSCAGHTCAPRPGSRAWRGRLCGA